MGEGLQVRFWGTRGSMAAPFPDRMGYGGNTSCVSVEWKEGMAVFDGGTGLVALGNWLEEEIRQGRRERIRELPLFVGHLHLDHIVGLPLFPCLFQREAGVKLYGPRDGMMSFRQRLSGMMGHPYWPVSMEQAAAKVAWQDTGEGDVWGLPGGVRVRVMKASHPNGCVLFRLEKEGQSVSYGLDCELGEEGGSFWESYGEFVKNSTLLIFDAPYDRETYPAFRGFGHSYWQQGVEMAAGRGIPYLAVSHHDWSQGDEALKIREGQAKALGNKMGVKAFFAREGMEICLGQGKATQNENRKVRRKGESE